MKPCDVLIRHVHLATMQNAIGAVDHDVVDDASLAISDGAIAWLGADAQIPSSLQATREYDGKGMWLTPGLIDCHTHLVYAGNRANEFEMRLQGESYESIARNGGGIIATVNATRAASEVELLHQSQQRLNAFIADGVTTMEIKSGYGLSLEAERMMLRVARALGKRIAITTTFLGAHALPVEFSGCGDEYIDYLIADVLPSLAKEGLVDAVDAFCETMAFSVERVERIFKAAQQLNLPVKLHAEQLSNQQGAELVAKYRGLSADHLEWLSHSGIEAMRSAGTVAVLLPAAFYFLRESHLPPIDELRRAAVPIAIASDCNPGSAPILSLLLAMNMACTMFRLTPDEVLLGVTRNAARALGMNDRGVLAVGKRADLCLWKVNRLAELCYSMGFNAGHHPLHARIFNGEFDVIH